MRTPLTVRQTTSKQETRRAQPRCEHDDGPGVAALVAAMTHPLKPTLVAVRRAILAADPMITEGIKWNSPSFYCHGWFATIGSRKPAQVDVVLHCGAKVRPNCGVRRMIDDPDRLLTWPSQDRALLSFKGGDEFQVRRLSFQRIIRQWEAYQKCHAGAV
jgi:hypothetical protein